MTVLKSTPTAREFASAWTSHFAAAVQQAAGTDGRITTSEVKRLSERPDAAGLFADDVNELFGTQKSMSVNKLIGLAAERVNSAATTAAGSNGELSLTEAKKLPKTLVKDFYFLRSRRPDGTPASYTHAEKQGITRTVLEALDKGTATKLSEVPFGIRGLRPIAEQVPHTATKSNASIYVLNDQIFISRGTNAPSPLAGWYHVGSVSDVKPAPKPTSDLAALKAELAPLTEGLWWPSESDASLEFLSGKESGTRIGEINFENVPRDLGSAYNALAASVFKQQGFDLPPMEGRGVQTRNFNDELTRYSTNFDPADPYSVDRAERIGLIKKAFEKHLTDLVVVRFGDASHGQVSGQVAVLILGRSKATGEVGGLMTVSIET